MLLVGGAGVRGVIDVYFDYFTNTLNFSNSRIYLTNQQPTTKKLIKLNSQSGCFWIYLNFAGGNPLCLGGFFGGYGRFFFRGMIIERGGTFVRRGNNGVWVGGLGGTFYIKMFKCVWLSCNIWYKTSTDYCFLSSWLSISISDDFRFLYNAYFGGNIGIQYLSS